ncbi:DUF2812 domain-containing protein [Dysosmobacter sp.]|uniref:DUF2812 domain-containing protein n=1 Tax=Dysosmobacter sp. TaxID=2591382 RepID=UPI002A876A49|nr:DUF2812 domain-containing protein [Dysosmobacter sp.]MDY3281560.1 DUF2812 domain-containing protein [Dysosmobacter sp.]
MAEKTTWQLLPADPWEVGAVEQWLEEEARQGRVFRKAGARLGTFRKEQPARCRVRCQLKGEGDDPDPETAELYARRGWYYLGRYGTWYWVWRCDDPTAPEPETDPASHSFAYERRRRQTKLSDWGNIVLMVGVILLFAVSLALKDRPVEYLVRRGSVSDFFIVAVYLVSIVTTLRSRRALRRMEETLAVGVPLDHTGPWRHLRRKALAWAAAYCALAAVMVGVLFFDVQGKTDTPSEPHCVSYETLTGGEAEDALRSFIPGGSFLAPRYENTTLRLYQGRQFVSEAVYDELRFAPLARLLYRERIAEFTDGCQVTDRRTIADSRFDEAEIITVSGCLTAFVGRCGNRVLFQYTDEETDLTAHIDDFASVIVQ